MGRDSKNHTPTLDIEPIKNATMNFYDHCCKKSMFPAGIEPTTSA